MDQQTRVSQVKLMGIKSHWFILGENEIYVIASSHKFKQVNLLAHEAGKSEEVQMILSMSQSECSNKLIRFDLLVSLFSFL